MPLSLSRFFLTSLKSAMIKGCREPPYPSILTDATMEKLALAKFVAQESKREVCLSAVLLPFNPRQLFLCGRHPSPFREGPKAKPGGDFFGG